MAADGHTVSGVNLPHIVLQPLEGNVNYKTDDIAPVFFFQYTADSVVVTEASPFNTIQELVSAAKANPEKFPLAGSGTFSANHTATGRLDKPVGVKITNVPFRGTGDLGSSVGVVH